jgi:hypothetical protein
MSVLEQYSRSETTLDDALRYYRSEGGQEELIRLAENQNLRGLALYVLSEIGATASTVWKKAIPYVSDGDSRTSYSALDLIHAYARGEEDYSYVHESVIKADLSKPVIFAKVSRILSSLTKSGAQRLFLHAMLSDPRSSHALGACILAFVDVHDIIESSFATGDEVLRVYLCALVFRDFSRSPLRRHLPEMMIEDLELLEKSAKPGPDISAPTPRIP